MNRSLALTLMLLLLLPGGLLLAQAQTGGIEGEIKDDSGAALPGVTVEAVNTRGQRFTTVSENNGRYRFPTIPPGTYTVTATLAGMETATTRDLQVMAGQSPKVDLTMRLGRVAEQITVTAEAPLVDVTSSATTASLTSETFDRLPRGRDFSTIVTQAASANQNDKTGGISIDGASGSENRFIMDGVDTTNPQTGVQGKTLITDFVDEVQVKSAGYAAEFGGATGGVINAITKTGTNTFSGQAGAYYSDRSWGGDVRPILQTQLGNSTVAELFTPKTDDTTLLEPSLFLGGPILKDNLWFFAGYQPWMENTTRTVTFVSGPSVGVTKGFDQSFTRNNYLATLSGTAGPKLLFKGSFNNSGYETDNRLPAVSGRTGDVNTFLSDDDAFENWTASGYADFIASPQWFFSAKGGRFYRNYYQTGIPKDVRIIFTSGQPSAFADIPASLHRPQGFNSIPTNSASIKDAYTRDNINLDVSWFPQFAGTHRIKGGVQFDTIENEVLRGQQNYLVTTFWNGVCDFCDTRGTYGSAGVYAFQTTGSVKQENTGFFIQDSWTTFNDRLTLDVGVRTEQERIPAYNAGTSVRTTGDYAIEFDYGDKLAPRFGFSYDLLGNGRSKVYGSYGTFYDIMKTEMPRGSFGGDKWIYWGFSINDPDWTKWGNCTNVTNDENVKPVCPWGTLQGGVDLRHPSNSADFPLIDPNLKPMESREINLGFQQELTNTIAVGFRYVNKELVRAIEDVGVLVAPAGGGVAHEEFFIANPGEGVAGKILAPTCPSCPAMPKPKRDYQGLEFEVTKRWSRNWYAHASYVYSKLEGNYSGLANSDEVTAGGGVARTSPNVNRIFDSLFMLFDREGREVEGVLGGDRPHQAKAQISYAFPFGTAIGANQYFYSGTPTTTEMRFYSAPFFAFGRNDMGRTPNVTQTDLTLTHDFRFGRYAVQVGGIVLNLFDEEEVTAIYPIYSTSSIRLRDLSKCGADLSVAGCGPSANTPLLGGATTGPAQEAAFFQGIDVERQIARQRALGTYTLDARYGRPMQFQDPRSVRVFAKLTF